MPRRTLASVGPSDESSKSDAYRHVAVLFELHHRALARYSRVLVRAEAIDDVVSETFILALQKSESGTVINLPWLLATAKNVARNSTRSMIRREAHLEAFFEDDDIPVDDFVDELLTKVSVIEAFDQLSLRDQEVLTLATIDGLSYAEAGALLDINASVFKSRLYRAKANLAQLLQPHTDIQMGDHHG